MIDEKPDWLAYFSMVIFLIVGFNMILINTATKKNRPGQTAQTCFQFL